MNNKTKRIIAWCAIILLAALYLSTLILAIAGVSIYNGLFILCLFSTFVVPVLAFVVIWLYDRFTNRRGPGDPYIEDEDTDN